MYAIPRHLSKIFRVDESRSRDNNLSGEICCACGGKKFRMKLFADTDAGGGVEAREYGRDWALAVKVRCAECKKERLLFDMSKHGYNGYVCHEGTAAPGWKLRPYTCADCGGDTFAINLCLETEDRDRFVEEIAGEDPGHFSEEDYAEAFNWITIDLKCQKCGRERAAWLDMEMA